MAAALAKNAAFKQKLFNQEIFHGTLHRTTSSNQPPVWSPHFWAIQISRAKELRPRHARAKSPPQAYRLRPGPDRKTEAPLLLRFDGTAVSWRVRARFKAPWCDRRNHAANFGNAFG